jgi:prepilin-type N-terminal cleavage/methylation domain-containing protein
MRRAFTLVEVMVALVITGLVVSMAYASVQAGLDTAERLTLAQQGEEREVVARTLLTRALRHALPGTLGGQPVFVLRDQPNGDALAFQTRGVVEPHGASSVWEVSLEPNLQGLRLSGRITDGSGASFSALLRRVRRVDVRVRGRDARDGWFHVWNFPDRSPVAVAITFFDARGQQLGASVTSRIGLEGNP